MASSFRTADKSGAGALSLDAFCAYYATLTTSRARQQLRTRMGLAAEGGCLNAACSVMHRLVADRLTANHPAANTHCKCHDRVPGSCLWIIAPAWCYTLTLPHMTYPTQSGWVFGPSFRFAGWMPDLWCTGNSVTTSTC